MAMAQSSLATCTGTDICMLSKAAGVEAAAAAVRQAAPAFKSFSGLHQHRLNASSHPMERFANAHSFMPNNIRLKASCTRICAAAAAGGSEEVIPALSILPIHPYITEQGRISPPVDPSAKASVFAVFDSNKKLQYIGFSKDLRNSMRTLLGRRPEFCYYIKFVGLPEVDQGKMLAVRQQWFSEAGLTPPGNADAPQRAMWEKPAEASSISERGKAAAAQSKAKTLLQMMADRGLKEEMKFDPKLLEEGKCEILPSRGQTAEEAAEAAQEAEESSAGVKDVVELSPEGEAIEFRLSVDDKIITNGGWMYDIRVSKDDKETRHRVVCGRIYPEAAKLDEDRFLERTIAFLLHKKVQRQTEGLLVGGQFPINYFAISEVAQNFDDFNSWFSGNELPDNYWRFNRIHSYGADSSPMASNSALPKSLSFPQY